MKYVVKPRLNHILKDKNMTQLQLSEITGISQAAISRFDRNSQHRDEHLIAISRSLKINVEELFDVEEIIC